MPTKHEKTIKLFEALKDAYPSRKDLEFELSLAGRVYEDLTPESTRKHEFLRIAQIAVARGWAGRFVANAAEKHDNALLYETLEMLGGPAVAAGQSSGVPPATVSAAAAEAADAYDEQVESALQRSVQGNNPNVDAMVLLERAAAAPPRIGAVEIVIDDDPSHRGTCFLVGPDLVLTNQHVVVDDDNNPVDNLRVRFDFAFSADGQRIVDGTLYNIADPLPLASSPPSAADETVSDNDIPNAQELDYALLKIDTAVGHLSPSGHGNGAEKRGWYSLKSDAALPRTGSEVLIFQHPMGQPLKLAYGRILGQTGQKRRLRYDANTKNGSSGSPVLNARGELAALHHAGDPNYARFATFNQGIPIGLIAEDLTDKGIDLPEDP